MKYEILLLLQSCSKFAYRQTMYPVYDNALLYSSKGEMLIETNSNRKSIEWRGICNSKFKFTGKPNKLVIYRFLAYFYICMYVHGHILTNGRRIDFWKTLAKRWR